MTRSRLQDESRPSLHAHVDPSPSHDHVAALRYDGCWRRPLQWEGDGRHSSRLTGALAGVIVEVGAGDHGSLLLVLRREIFFLSPPTNVDIHDLHDAAAVCLTNANLDRQDAHLATVGAIGLGAHVADNTQRAA